VTFPVGIPVGVGTLHPHFVFETAAYIAGFRLYLLRRARRGDHIGDADRWSIVTAAAVGAVVGSRLLNWVEDPAAAAAALANPLTLLGGKTIVGALLGGWIAVEAVKRKLGIRVATGDLFAVPLAVGIAVGRIGCFLSGLPDGTYGLETSLPWGVDFGDGVLRHPTAAYESVFAAVLAAVLMRFERAARLGDAFKAFMSSYLAFRFAIEFLKPRAALLGGLSAIQWACLGGLAYYSWWFLARRPERVVVQAQEV
jgi:phosphatidylglycerol---prolipoprotein diacylglyceryl transferase